MKNDDKSVETARVNARQAIIVAIITGIVSIASTLIATGYLSPGRARVGTSAAGGESISYAPVLDAPHLYFSTKQTDLSLDQCMKKAKDGLERARLSGHDSKRYFAWGYQNKTTGLIWCDTDEKLVIFLAAGKDDREASLIREALSRSF